MESTDDLEKRLAETRLRHMEIKLQKAELECRELTRHPFMRETYLFSLGSLLLTFVTAVPSVFTAWTATRNTQNVLSQKDQIQRVLHEEESLARQQDSSLSDLSMLRQENAELKRTLDNLQQQATEESRLLYRQARETATQQLNARPEGGKVATIFLASEEQRARADALKTKLTESGLEVGEIKLREGAAPYTTEIHFFHDPEDLALAQWLAQQLQDPVMGGFPKTRATYTPRKESPEDQVEIHFGREVKSGPE